MDGRSLTSSPARRRRRGLLPSCWVALLLAGAAPQAAAEGPRPELARGKLLVASDKLVDPNFRETVVLLLEHDASGALGVALNRPTEVRVALLLPEVEELGERPDTVFLGGPVARDRMVILVRAPSQPAESVQVVDGVYATARLDLLRELASTPRAESRFRVYVGFAGWAPQQLEAEVERGDWHILSGDAASVFHADPATLWPKLHERSSGQWARSEAWHLASLR